ncbi:ankyrin repeat domain-containing protein [Streptomyces sp. ICN988]|uniref:ankyrin repeat domain-containing protein n=1 Tax=Streptomyces sp. ICN988 TaxID=2983765 RepID=UPI002961EAD6|nr:ankyrin repeat domain-containing protein [Streptomyces sp. ICN988]
MDFDALGPSSWPEVEPWTPAHQAVEISEYETLSMLLNAGADPNEVFFELTLLTHAIDSEGDSHLQSGHPLHTASTAIVLAYGADPHLPTASGETPLQLAESYDHGPAKRLLQRFLAPAETPQRTRGVGRGSSVEVESWTPVHRAVEMSDYETLTALLDSGADPSEVCFGDTLLTHAIGLEGDGHVQTNYPLNTASTAILLAYGADPCLPAIDGETPLQVAEYYHHEPIKRLLQRFLALTPAKSPGECP